MSTQTIFLSVRLFAVHGCGYVRVRVRIMMAMTCLRKVVPMASISVARYMAIHKQHSNIRAIHSAQIFALFQFTAITTQHSNTIP